jgi:hypothetical protein
MFLEGLRIPIDQTFRIVLLIVIKQAWMKAADMVHSAVKRTGKRLDNHFFSQTVCQKWGNHGILNGLHRLDQFLE